MINESPNNKNQIEYDEKSKKFDSLMRAYNEKGLFPFSLENHSINFSTKISSPTRKTNIKQKFEFSSLKKDFTINNKSYDAFSGNKLPDFIYGYPQDQAFDFSFQKDYIKKENDLNAEKRIKYKLDNIFENILLSKKKNKEKENNECLDNINDRKDYPIILTINDKFFDLLNNIYINGEETLEKKENFSGKKSKTKEENINQKIQIEEEKQISIDINLGDDNNEEQISCICLKSKCLNDYCRCHKNRKICNSNCRCTGCKNNNKYSNQNLTKIICKCKKSNCSWNYCECKRRGILCGIDCCCSNCKNSKKNKYNFLK